MANLTIAVDDDVLHRARIRAAEQGTSVNAVLRTELIRYADSTVNDGIDGFLEMARSRTQPGTGSGSQGRRWNRADLYAERLERYGPDRPGD